MSFHTFNAVKLRVRGDGRKYLFESLCDVSMETKFMYVTPIYTNGGPLWQEITVIDAVYFLIMLVLSLPNFYFYRMQFHLCLELF